MKRIIYIFALAALCSSMAFGQARGEVLIKNATVLTAARGTLEGTDILIRDGKIARIGKNLSAGSTAKVFDATGKFVSPGIIDAHSHSMLNAINEGSLAVTSMTNVRDVLDAAHDAAPAVAEALEDHVVSRAVGNVRNNGPELISPVED